MNVKKMTTEQLREEALALRGETTPMRPCNKADEEFLTACLKELARRWGIK